MAVAPRHVGLGQCLSAGLLTLAVCHHRLREVAEVGDCILVVTPAPSTSSVVEPQAYKQAVRCIGSMRRLVVAATVTKSIPFWQYYKGNKYPSRRDNLYAACPPESADWVDARGQSWKRRAGKGLHETHRSWGLRDLSGNVLLRRQFRIYPCSLVGSPVLPEIVQSAFGTRTGRSVKIFTSAALKQWAVAL